MKVFNTHESEIKAPGEQVGALIDSLASRRNALWPTHSWPKMAFDRPLGVGATGGHGPIKYFVEDYAPGQFIRFRFTSPKGFDGWHGYETVDSPGPAVVLRHTLEMTTHGLAALSWPIVFRPLHDALIEDSLAAAQASFGLSSKPQAWSPWVRFLRWVLVRIS
jgi:hypothetical protein